MSLTLENRKLSKTTFLGCAVVGKSQGDEHYLMLKTSCCGHERSCKKGVWNKLFLLE